MSPMCDFLILTSPPASGKTFWIESFAQSYEGSLLVISPLRALADECREMWGNRITVMTPEEWLGKKNFSDVVIMDEFHLLFYWGDTFRHVMWEVFESLSSEAKLVIGLTATLPEDIKERVATFSCHFDSLHWIDMGNQTLRWLPENYFQVSRDLLTRCALFLPHKGTSILFCEFRKEVLDWEKCLRDEGYSTWSCRGGEAPLFREKIKNESPPDFIISTSVLSHGVNLPPITRVFLSYSIKNRDFWVQMIARGGRRGEKYEVFALEPPYSLRWSRGKNLFKTGILHLKTFLPLLRHQLQECFLKE